MCLLASRTPSGVRGAPAGNHDEEEVIHMYASELRSILIIALQATSVGVPAQSYQDGCSSQSDGALRLCMVPWRSAVLQAALAGPTLPQRYSPQEPNGRRGWYSPTLIPAMADDFSDDLRRRIEHGHGYQNVDEVQPRREMGQVVWADASLRPRGPVLQHRRWVDPRP